MEVKLIIDDFKTTRTRTRTMIVTKDLDNDLIEISDYLWVPTSDGKYIGFVNDDIVDKIAREIMEIIESGFPVSNELETLVREYQLSRNGGEE